LKPFSAARAMNINSAHSPRSLGFRMRKPADFKERLPKIKRGPEAALFLISKFRISCSNRKMGHVAHIYILRVSSQLRGFV